MKILIHTTHDDIPSWIEPHRAAFLQRLERLGYSKTTWKQYADSTACFCAALRSGASDHQHLNGNSVIFARAKALEGVTRSVRSYAVYQIDQFVNWLVEAGLATLPQPAPQALAARDILREEYVRYLRVVRGLSDETIYQCVCIFERFMRHRFGDNGSEDVVALTMRDITTFCLSQRSRSSWPSHLRKFFEFLFWCGRTTRNLATAIPRVKVRTGSANLPRFIQPAEVQRLVEAVRSDDALGRRDYAILLLMARLGLRSPEVVAVQLEDIDWRAGELLVRGKGRLHDRLPLPPDVGEAIVQYIQQGRMGESRTLFVSHRAPHKPFKDAQIINEVLRKACARTGMTPPHRYLGSYVLRHSLATAMLGQGASLEEIGHVLRHRSRATTAIYAKCDLDALRSLTQNWPTEGGAL